MTPLGDVISIEMGQAPPGKACNKQGRGVPFVKAGEFGPSRPVIREWTTDPKKFAKKTDVLVCVVGATCGKINLGEDCAIGRSVAALRPDPNKIDQFYLHYFLHGTVEQLRSGSQGSAQTVISKAMLAELEIPLPQLEEQKRIVAVLDQAFAALDRARALAEANLVDAEELFDGWLTAVFHDHPAEWASRKLRDLCHQITVGHVGPMADRYSSAGTPFLRSQNVRPFRIDLADVKFIDDAFRSELKKSELRPGDVAIVRTGYPGTAAVIPDDLPLANCADLVIARPKDELHPEFLAMFLNSSFGKKMVAEKSVGAAQKHFNVGAAKEVDFAYPEPEEQLAIVNNMQSMRGYSKRLHDQCQEKIDELQSLRQSLLQKAFAGELT